MTVNKKKLVGSVKFISRLLKYEFIYEPGPTIEDNFKETLQLMVSRSVRSPSLPIAQAFFFSRSRRRGILAASSDGESISIQEQGKEVFLFLCMLVWPFIEIYW